MWSASPSRTKAFLEVSSVPQEMTTGFMSKFEQFMVLLYDRTSGLTTADEDRRVLFGKKNRSLENIPPTDDALRKHPLHAVCQAGRYNHCSELQNYQTQQMGMEE